MESFEYVDICLGGRRGLDEGSLMGDVAGSVGACVSMDVLTSFLSAACLIGDSGRGLGLTRFVGSGGSLFPVRGWILVTVTRVYSCECSRFLLGCRPR